MFGHGRVLPPEARTFDAAKAASRLLIVKAARRMRREKWNAGRLWLSVQMAEKGVGRSAWLPDAHDDQIILSTLESLWADLKACLPRRVWIISVHVMLGDISPAGERQMDLLLNDDKVRRRWETITATIDKLNAKHGRTLVSIGPWTPPPGGYAGSKISYTRIPRMEDAW
jgi:DNA polymerase-4